VGMEMSGPSLKSFRFARIGGEMCTVYEFWKDLPEIFPRDDVL
jgi:hypothetical protein